MILGDANWFQAALRLSGGDPLRARVILNEMTTAEIAEAQGYNLLSGPHSQGNTDNG